jgi:hypothetical protein
MKLRTNFDIYLKDQFKDASFSERFKKAAKAWDVAIHLAALRCKKNLGNSVHPTRPVKCGTYLTGVNNQLEGDS